MEFMEEKSMNYFFTKYKNLIFLFFISLIILSNYVVFNIEAMQPLPNGAIIGSLIDFLIVIPLLTYFFIIRKKYSLKYMGVVLLAGYGVAYLIIPNHLLSSYTFVPYLIGFSEGALILLELFILYKVIRTLPKMIKEYKEIKGMNSYFLYNVKKSVTKYMPNNRFIHVFMSELTMFYYALFCWRKKVHITGGKSFTYHKKTSAIAAYIMLIHATALESVGLHYLLHQWSEIVAYILLILNIYAILYFLAEIQAIRLSPFLLMDDTLYLQVGFTSSMELPLSMIKELKHYDGPEKLSKSEKGHIFDARVIDFFQEKPTFEITFKEKQTLHLMYGITREVDRVLLNVDDQEEFYRTLHSKLS